MKPNETVTIRRVGNGFIVEPEVDRNCVIDRESLMVFQDKGYVSFAREGQPVEQTLFGWLDRHFSEPRHD